MQSIPLHARMVTLAILAPILARDKEEPSLLKINCMGALGHRMDLI